MVGILLFPFFQTVYAIENLASTGKRTSIIALRHGETYLNKSAVIQGQVNNIAAAQLNAEGRAQAARLGSWLFEHYPDINPIIYSSSLGRARETAAIVNACFNHSLTIVNGEKEDEEERAISDGLKEICHGPYDATLNSYLRTEKCLEEYARMIQEFQASHPGQSPDRFFFWKTNPITKIFPRPELNEYNAEEYNKKPETVYELYLRATAAIQKIVKLHDEKEGPIMIFGHGALFATLIDECKYRDKPGPIPVHYAPEATHIKNCGVCHFYFDHDLNQLFFEGLEMAK